MPVRRVVIDHLAVGVSDIARSREFYARALAPLGFSVQGPWREGGAEVAFGTDGYYGAFILDFDRPNVEAVCHDGR